MKSLLKIIFALLLTVVGFGVIALNVHSLTTTLLIFSGSCLALAMGLAIPADLKGAIVIVAPYVPLLNGRRASDPQVVPPDPSVVDDAAGKSP